MINVLYFSEVDTE